MAVQRRSLDRIWDRLSFARVGPFREGTFRSPLHSERVAAILGISLGVTFGLCFVTGILSDLIQNPPSWFTWPARPSWLYRATQGVHVASGIAAIPILLAKLWTVYPKLFKWPPVHDVAQAVERLSLFPLVAGGVFMLFTGLANTYGWYPWGFFFPTGHYWGAWITIGALVVHVGAKSAVTWSAVRGRRREEPDADPSRTMDRRGFLATAFGAAGLLTLVTVGQTVRPLRGLAVLAPRDPAVGPQGLPVNKSAASAGVLESAVDPSWRLRVTGRVDRELELSLDELRRLPQREAVLTIACVEGWSATGRWRGVPLRDLVEMAGGPGDATCRVESLQDRGLYRAADVNRPHLNDPDTLLALELDGEPLHIEHGFPCRLIGPNRPGVMQTKWVTEVVVT